METQYLRKDSHQRIQHIKENYFMTLPLRHSCDLHIQKAPDIVLGSHQLSLSSYPLSLQIDTPSVCHQNQPFYGIDDTDGCSNQLSFKENCNETPQLSFNSIQKSIPIETTTTHLLNNLQENTTTHCFESSTRSTATETVPDIMRVINSLPCTHLPNGSITEFNKNKLNPADDSMSSTISEGKSTFSLQSSGCSCPCSHCSLCLFKIEPHKSIYSSMNPKPSKRYFHYYYYSIFHDIKQMFKRCYCHVSNLQVKQNPMRYTYDSHIIPESPISIGKQKLLKITELPFLILWVYFTYWIVIVSMTISSAPTTVWFSALIAGLLVGIGLNANAYKTVTIPKKKQIIHHLQQSPVVLQQYEEPFHIVEMMIDWGIVIRFFIIPFGVSSLSGLTNSLRDQFLLVFPRDPFYLTIAMLCPAAVIGCLGCVRLMLLWHLRVRWSFHVLFLNGALVD